MILGSWSGGYRDRGCFLLALRYGSFTNINDSIRKIINQYALIFDYFGRDRYNSRPMSDMQLPTRLDLGRLRNGRQNLEGQFSLTAFSRLSEMLEHKEGQVAVDITVGVDEEGYQFIDGHIDTAVDLQCQRCLQPYQHQLRADFKVSPVLNDNQAKLLPKNYEPVMIENNSLDIEQLVEDEIILNLPLVPKHQTEQCKTN